MLPAAVSGLDDGDRGSWILLPVGADLAAKKG